MTHPINQPQPFQQPQPLQSQQQFPTQQPPQPLPVQQQPSNYAQASAPAPAPMPTPAPAFISAPMGWYPVPGTSNVRWWDGANWTAYKIRNGEPRPDWYMTEPPNIGFIFGPIFLVSGVWQLSLNLTLEGSSRSWNGPLFILLGIFWIFLASLTAIVRSKPNPMTAQTLLPITEPLPGRVEGPGAGWITLSSRVRRWWSGARWGEYIYESQRVRPTYGGRRLYRRSQIFACVLGGVGLLAVILGALLFTSLYPYAPNWMGTAALTAGITLIVVSVIVFPVLYVRRHAYLLPKFPPTYAAAPQQY